MADVVCFGELLVDMVGESGASLADSPRFLKAPGGAPANVAVGLSRLGTSCEFIGGVGDDPFGHWLLQTLRDEAVGTNYMFISPEARTTLAFIATRADGRKDISFYRNPGADAQFSVEEFNPLVLNGARIFHCGSVSLSLNPCRDAQLHAARQAKNAGLLISYDPNWRPSLWSDFAQARDIIWEMMSLADVVKVADEEWEFVTGTADFAAGARKILAVGPRLVIVTRGADGAYFDCAHARGFVPGFAVEAIDTLGAGDAFVAGLLTRLLQTPLEQVLNEEALHDITRFANACGALATQQRGGIPSLPSRPQVEVFLKQANG